jgi:hypothetical protein
MKRLSSIVLRSLKGLKILIIGGAGSADHLRRLQAAFAPLVIEHLETRKGDASSRSFLAALQRPGVGLVIWLSGRTRTNHGRELRNFCNALGIPWLPFASMPHPNALAAALSTGPQLNALGKRRIRDNRSNEERGQ